MIDQITLEAFRYWRQKPGAVSGLAPFEGAAAMLARARAEVAEGKPRRYTGAATHYARKASNEPFFVEDPASVGLRQVGFSDEVAKAYGSRSIQHQGWYSDAFQDETYRGAVFQLPARDGRERFLAAYAQGDGWIIDPSQVFSETTRTDTQTDVCDLDSALEAARSADQMAEREAAKEREYQEAWQAGARWNELGDEIKAARRGALTILRERKRLAAADLPASRDAVCDHVRRLIEHIAEMRDERRKLTQDFKWRADAFNEGAGLAIIA